MNLCAACGLEFTGVRDFDSHRVGVHAYTFVQGLWLDPSREDGRRCLDAKEMIADGWFLDRHGRWSHPRRKASNRRHSRPETRRTALRRPSIGAGRKTAEIAAPFVATGGVRAVVDGSMYRSLKES